MKGRKVISELDGGVGLGDVSVYFQRCDGLRMFQQEWEGGQRKTRKVQEAAGCYLYSYKFFFSPPPLLFFIIIIIVVAVIIIG